MHKSGKALKSHTEPLFNYGGHCSQWGTKAPLFDFDSIRDRTCILTGNKSNCPYFSKNLPIFRMYLLVLPTTSSNGVSWCNLIGQSRAIQHRPENRRVDCLDEDAWLCCNCSSSSEGAQSSDGVFVAAARFFDVPWIERIMVLGTNPREKQKNKREMGGKKVAAHGKPAMYPSTCHILQPTHRHTPIHTHASGQNTLNTHLVPVCREAYDVHREVFLCIGNHTH